MNARSSRDRLAAVTARTAGVFSRADARAAGYSAAEVRGMLRSGRWVALRRGVYAEKSVLDDANKDSARHHALAMAGLLLALGCDAVAAGTSAAEIWGLSSLHPPDPELVVVTAQSVRNKRRDGYVLRSGYLPASHRSVRHRVPLTSVARTVIDLARTQPFREAVVLADSALHQRRVSLSQLHVMLDECSQWPAISKARLVVDLADPNAESVLESVSRVAMREQNLPRPKTQVQIGDEKRGPIARVDFLWDDVKVIGEADGLGKYEPDGRRTTREIVRAEKRREERLTDLGFEIVRWGLEDAQDPPRLACRLRSAFARGADRLAGRHSRAA